MLEESYQRKNPTWWKNPLRESGRILSEKESYMVEGIILLTESSVVKEILSKDESSAVEEILLKKESSVVNGRVGRCDSEQTPDFVSMSFLARVNFFSLAHNR